MGSRAGFFQSLVSGFYLAHFDDGASLFSRRRQLNRLIVFLRETFLLFGADFGVPSHPSCAVNLW